MFVGSALFTSSQYQEITDSFLKEAEEDYIGLWQLIKEAKRFATTEEPLVVQAVTLAIVREFLAAGLEAGEPPYSVTGYIPWPDQNPDAVTSRIEQEWEALGREPNIGEICWFNLPKK